MSPAGPEAQGERRPLWDRQTRACSVWPAHMHVGKLPWFPQSRPDLEPSKEPNAEPATGSDFGLDTLPGSLSLSFPSYQGWGLNKAPRGPETPTGWFMFLSFPFLSTSLSQHALGPLPLPWGRVGGSGPGELGFSRARHTSVLQQACEAAPTNPTLR